jgi:hypothetical protein
MELLKKLLVFLNPTNNVGATNIAGTLTTVGTALAAIILVLNNIQGILCKLGVAASCLPPVIPS